MCRFSRLALRTESWPKTREWIHGRNSGFVQASFFICAGILFYRGWHHTPRFNLSSSPSSSFLDLFPCSPGCTDPQTFKLSQWKPLLCGNEQEEDKMGVG